MKFLDQTIWITGASSGVGEGLARVFHREGANIIVSARREAELERVTLLSGLPSDSIDLSLAEYRRAASDPPPGADPQAYRKSLLAELILRWREAESNSPPTDRPLDELEAVFLMMRSPFDVKTRQRMLSELKNATAKEPDPEQAVKRKLLEWIATFGHAPDEEIPVVLDE